MDARSDMPQAVVVQPAAGFEITTTGQKKQKVRKEKAHYVRVI